MKKTKNFNESNFEVHIVGYKGTDLSHAPKPYFNNEILGSTQGFSGIETVESNDLSEAYKEFEKGLIWSKKQLSIQKEFGVHIKLEAIKDQIKINKPILKKLPEPRLKKFKYIKSQFVAAWDVHLDGFFNEHLKNILHKDGYIIMDYISSDGENIVTLTMHFLKPRECADEYHRIINLIKKSGGFVGNIYYEDPLAFVVYGETIPRPIVES